jgi:hypothetical protein
MLDVGCKERLFMSELLSYVQELGGSLHRTVDTDTGEIIFMRESVAVSDSDGGAVPSGSRHAERDTLSTCHISPQIIIRSGASVLTVKRSPKPIEEEHREEVKEEKTEYEKPKRGEVAGFSAKSRNRLMRTLASVKRDNLPLFVTLTFPSDYPTAERAKKDLDNFLKRLARRFPEVAGVWKLEPQKRGAPHFHLLVWGVAYTELLAFVPVNWYQVVKSGDPNHLAWHKGELGNKPCVQQIESQRGVFWYASKYMSKEVGSMFTDWGRWWGVFFRERLPFGELVNVEVTKEKAMEFIRYMRRYAHIKSRDYKSLTIICNADFWINRLL